MLLHVCPNLIYWVFNLFIPTLFAVCQVAKACDVLSLCRVLGIDFYHYVKYKSEVVPRLQVPLQWRNKPKYLTRGVLWRRCHYGNAMTCQRYEAFASACKSKWLSFSPFFTATSDPDVFVCKGCSFVKDTSYGRKAYKDIYDAERQVLSVSCEHEFHDCCRGTAV